MRLARNTLFSLMSTGLPVIISIVTVPLYISQIGAERYGALAICWLLLGYFGQADFGLGRAITQRIGSMAGAPRSEMSLAVASALAAILVFSLFSAMLVYFSADYFFSGPFQIEEGLRAELVRSAWALALCTPVVALIGVGSGSLMGLEQFKLASFGNLASTSGMQVLPLLAAYFYSQDLLVLVICALVGRAIGIVIVVFGVWQTFLSGEAIRVSWKEIKRLLGFGVWIMVTALIGPLMIIADRFIIGVVLGAVAVAAYTIPFQIASRAQVLPIALVQALFPRFASETGSAALARCRQYTALIGQLFTPVIVGMICLAAPLLTLWLGEDLDWRSVPVAHALLVGFWFNALANVPYAFLQARGNPRFTALLHLAELPFYFAVLYSLGTYYGLVGFAAAYSLRCLVDLSALLAKSGMVAKRLLGQLLPQVVLIALALLAAQSFASWAWLLASGCALGLASLGFTLWQMPEEIRERLASLGLGRFVPFLQPRT